MRPAGRQSRATTAGTWLFAAVVPASALALGSIPSEVLVGMSAVAALACGLLSSDREARPLSSASRWVLVALGLLLAMTVLQAIPVPDGVARALSPANADIWERALTPLREPGPAWHPLSVAPAATRVEVLRGFFYGCVFLSALRVAALPDGEALLVRLIMVSTVIMALSALAHMAVSAERVFGVYRPRETYAYRTGRLTPLLNTNHLAAYLNIGACVTLWALVARRAIPRALSASALLVLAVTSVWQGSRGATGTLALGAVLTIGLTLYAKRSFGGGRANAAVLALCTVAAAFMGTLALVDSSRGHLLTTDLTKLDVARSSARLVASSPWFGVGRGGFESVFSSVREGTTYVTFTHPEDIVVQWVVEWGVPVSLVGFGLLAWALRPQLVLRAARPVVGVWVAVLVTVLHELVDFHLEVPGVVALVAVCIAMVVSGRPVSRDAGKASGASSPRLVAGVLIAGTAAAIVFVWPEMGHSLAKDRRALSAMSVDRAATAEEFRAAARAAMLRFPAEPFLPLMGAVRAQMFREGSVVPWIGRALERNPRFGRAHFVLARSLAAERGHAAQARLEYRLAYENDVTLRDAIVKETLPLIDDASSALELVPESDPGIDMLEALIAEFASVLPSTVVVLDRELERRAPKAFGPLRRRAEAEGSDAIGAASWCAGSSACMDAALATAEEVARREPNKCEPHVLVARLGIASGKATAALDRLEHETESVTDRPACQRQLITLAIEAGQTRRAELALDSLVRAGCGAASECLALYSWAASIEESRGHYLRAVQLHRRVLDLTPDRDDLLEHIGSLGERDGVLADALDAYTSLATRHPSDPRWPARIAELRARGRPAPRPPIP